MSPRRYQGTSPYPNRIRARREQLELNQTALAERIDLERSWLSRIENGEALATPEQLRALERALECRGEDLYARRELAFIRARSVA